MEMEALAPWKMMQPDPETGEDRLAKELLPKILITDPVVQVIKELAETADSAAHLADPDHTPLAAGWIADRVEGDSAFPVSRTNGGLPLIVEGN